MKKYKVLFGFTALVLCAALWFNLALSPATAFTVSTQQGKSTYVSLTNLPTFVVGAGQSNLTSYTSQTIDLVQGKGLGVTAYFAGTNALTVETQTISVAGSYDGTNYATTNFWILTGPANGATGQRLSTNFPASMTDNFRTARVAHYRNGADATNRVFLTNIVLHIDR